MPSLNIYRPPGTLADADNSVLVPAAGRIEVSFLPAVSGDILELAFAGDRRAIATIESVGAAHAQDLIIGPVEGGSMQPRYVPLDKAWREMKIERLRLRVADAGGPLQWGYAFVYQDTRP